jgi:hypothetical protein
METIYINKKLSKSQLNIIKRAFVSTLDLKVICLNEPFNYEIRGNKILKDILNCNYLVTLTTLDKDLKKYM